MHRPALSLPLFSEPVDLFAVFVILSAIGAAALLALSIAATLRAGFRFWPPPAKGSWQDRWFIWLFRAMVYGLVAASLVWWFAPDRATPPMVWPGIALAVIGFAGAFASTAKLGWRNAFGDRNGLVTDGWFRWSRNPVYVLTWVGLAGWALIVPVWPVWAVLMAWATLYLLAARLEEPWLEAEYGEAYRQYCRAVPRFLIIR